MMVVIIVVVLVVVVIGRCCLTLYKRRIKRHSWYPWSCRISSANELL